MVTSETFINPVNFEDALPVGGPWVGPTGKFYLLLAAHLDPLSLAALFTFVLHNTKLRTAQHRQHI
jgi:hypothetical protein